MKLKELVKDFSSIKGEELKKIKESILECDEFKNVQSLIILESPVVVGDNDKILSTSQVKIQENLSFSGTVYLYDIKVNKNTNDITNILSPIKEEGAAVTNCMMGFSGLKPLKKIILDFSIENLQDDDNKERNRLHQLLDNVLDNVNSYENNKMLDVFLRGIF